MCPSQGKDALLQLSLGKIQSSYLWKVMYPTQIHPAPASHGRERFRKTFVNVDTSQTDDSDDSRDTKSFETGWHNHPYCRQTCGSSDLEASQHSCMQNHRAAMCTAESPSLRTFFSSAMCVWG